MLQLRQFDLEFPFPGGGTLGENVEDKRGAVQNLAVKEPLEVSALRGREFVVKYYGVDVCLSTMVGKLFCFPFPYEGRGARRSQLLNTVADHICSGAHRQLG